MTQPAKSQEPSMEEILASIRRIIADDDATKSSQGAPEDAKPASSAAPSMPPARPAAAAPLAMPAAPTAMQAAPGAMPAVPPQSLSPAARVAAPEPVEPEPEPAPSSIESDQADETEQTSDILDLTESMAVEPPAEAMAVGAASTQFRTIDGTSDVGFDDVSEKPVPQRIAAPRMERAVERAQLVSQETSAAVDSAFNALAQTVLVHNARTLEDLVREMLRPMLKSWLDDNLPGVVERLVRAEIERVSRGRMA